jgi:hypothetical protein
MRCKGGYFANCLTPTVSGIWPEHCAEVCFVGRAWRFIKMSIMSHLIEQFEMTFGLTGRKSAEGFIGQARCSGGGGVTANIKLRH